MSLKKLFAVSTLSLVAAAYSGFSAAQINGADPDARQQQSSQPQGSTPGSQQPGDAQKVTQASPSSDSGPDSDKASETNAQEKSGQSLLIVFPLLVLAGLCFAMFIGRRRRMVGGVMSAPAPGSQESPVLGDPRTAAPRRRS